MASYQHILTPLDFSQAAHIVGRRAGELARCLDARLTLVHMIESKPFHSTYNIPELLEFDWEAEEHHVVEQAQKQLNELATELGLTEAGQLIRIGPAKSELIQVADEQEIDLIVIGSHGHHGVTRLLGSTATAAVHNAQCDVLAVRVD